MKATGLIGDYCQTCATNLDRARVNPKRVIILDNECARVFEQSGDAERFEGPAHNPPALPTYETQKESEPINETVKVAPKAKAAPRSFGRKK